MSRWGDAFVHLNDLHVFPGDRFVGQVAQHQPRRAPAAHGDHEATAKGDGVARRGRHHGGGPSSRRIRVGEYFDLHGASPLHRDRLIAFANPPA
ncbi:MAG TPA: hypothetical protein VMS17_33120 [Gemmataceae bacterium]|nr:hypothetical protein [Gemmataceae bacterium]